MPISAAAGGQTCAAAGGQTCTFQLSGVTGLIEIWKKNQNVMWLLRGELGVGQMQTHMHKIHVLGCEFQHMWPGNSWTCCPPGRNENHGWGKTPQMWFQRVQAPPSETVPQLLWEDRHQVSGVVLQINQTVDWNSGCQKNCRAAWMKWFVIVTQKSRTELNFLEGIGQGGKTRNKCPRSCETKNANKWQVSLFFHQIILPFTCWCDDGSSQGRQQMFPEWATS